MTRKSFILSLIFLHFFGLSSVDYHPRLKSSTELALLATGLTDDLQRFNISNEDKDKVGVILKEISESNFRKNFVDNPIPKESSRSESYLNAETNFLEKIAQLKIILKPYKKPNIMIAELLLSKENTLEQRKHFLRRITSRGYEINNRKKRSAKRAEQRREKRRLKTAQNNSKALLLNNPSQNMIQSIEPNLLQQNLFLQQQVLSLQHQMFGLQTAINSTQLHPIPVPLLYPMSAVGISYYPTL